MTDEIICECGHDVSIHGDASWCIAPNCECTKNVGQVYRARIAALTLAVGERDMQIKKLREVLMATTWAVTKTELRNAKALVERTLAETAPATEAGK